MDPISAGKISDDNVPAQKMNIQCSVCEMDWKQSGDKNELNSEAKCQEQSDALSV